MEPSHRFYAPDPADVEWANGVVKVFEEEGLAKGKAAVSYLGKMVDTPVYLNAKDILAAQAEIDAQGKEIDCYAGHVRRTCPAPWRFERTFWALRRDKRVCPFRHFRVQGRAASGSRCFSGEAGASFGTAPDSRNVSSYRQGRFTATVRFLCS